MLKFLGRRSAFHAAHNNAFFVDGDRLVLIDCAMDGFHKIRKLGEEKLAGGLVREFVVLVTHTHGDHVGGVPMLIHYAYYILKKTVTVIAPSGEVREDMAFLFDRLEGCAKDGYRLITVDEAEYPWLKCAISTKHAPELEGRCFGYQLLIDGRNVIYTGDTCMLDPFLPYIEEGTVLYTEVSAFKTPVHFYVGNLLEKETLFRDKKVEVFMMHLDDKEAILEATRDTGYKLAPLVSEN